MKKRFYLALAFVLQFVIIAFLINSLIDFGVRRSSFEQYGKVNSICSRTIDPQLIVFGSSVSEVGVSPAILAQRTGLNVYNASIDGTRFQQLTGLIRYFNTYSTNCKTVVLCETYFTFSRIDAISKLDRYLANLDNDLIYHSLYKMQPDLVWKCRHIPLYKFIVQDKDYYKNSFNGWKNFISGNTNKTDAQLGYYPVDRMWEADQDEVLKAIKPFKIEIDQEILAEYEKTIVELEKKHRNVVIVLPPVYKKISNEITDFTPLRNTFRYLASKYNCHFFDFSINEIGDRKQYFYNSNHVNLQGSMLFSQLLADSLIRIFPEKQ